MKLWQQAVGVVMQAEEELALLTSAKAGNKEAHGKLVLSVIPRINKLARSHAAKHEGVTSADLSQHGVLKLLTPSVLDAFEPFMPWMHYAVRVADNAMWDMVRAENVRQAVSLDRPASDTEVPLGDLLESTSPRPEQYLAVKERAAMFDRVAPTLTRMQQAVIATVADDLTVPEAVQRLGINSGTYKCHLSRARKALNIAIR